MSAGGAVHGWGCTPTGDAASAAADPRTTCFPAALTKGWRRTTLYAILILLLLIVFLNIALTLWIISALKLSMKGIGPLKIVKGGLQLDGQAWVTDTLVASSIASRVAQPLTLHSFRNFTVLVEEPNQVERAKLLIKRDGIECTGESFEVRDVGGASVFRASRDEVRVRADSLAIDGGGGLAVHAALQTSSVKAPPGSDLQLESLTRRLDLRAPQSITLESRAGSIDISSHGNIKMDSIVGAIKIDAPNIIISNLKEAVITDKVQNSKSTRPVKVYQLCACDSGKLFLAAPDAPCAADEHDTELCR